MPLDSSLPKRKAELPPLPPPSDRPWCSCSSCLFSLSWPWCQRDSFVSLLLPRSTTSVSHHTGPQLDSALWPCPRLTSFVQIHFGVQCSIPRYPGLQGKANEKAYVWLKIILVALCGARIYVVLGFATTKKTCPSAVCPGGWYPLASRRLLQLPTAGWFILAAFQYIPSV